MSKELVEVLKRKYGDKIAQKTSDGTSNIIIHNSTMHSDYCFARLFRQIREISHTFESFHYVLYFDRSSKIFDHNSLHQELNKLFGQYFRVVRYFSGKKNVRILSFESKKKFTHWKLWWMAVYLASCMLRLTDGNFENDWKKYFDGNGRKKRIDNWEDLIYLFHRYVYSTNKGYELNDNLAKKALVARGKRGGEDVLKELSANYLTVLYEVFGKDFVVTKPMVSYLANWDTTYKYQTAVFNAIKHLKEFGND